MDNKVAMANSDIAAARQALESLLEEATLSLAEKRYEEAARKVQTAANSAYLRHPGIFCSRKAEEILGEISRICLPTMPSGRVIFRDRKPHILHVLTQAHSPGGHTKLVRNWIKSDVGSSHSVALTQQLLQPVPPWLTNSVESSNGQMWAPDENQNLLERSKALRGFAREFDTIVLHVHPFDVVPSIAWSGSTAHPPIIHLNHADHLFWIGTFIPDLVANIRPSGYETSITRRGLESAANVLLPIPLVKDREQLPPRQTAKALLDIAEDRQLALTVASSYKFHSVGEMDYVKLHLPLLERCPRLQIIVVGPSHKENYWKDCSRLTEGRIRAVGVKLDLTNYWAAADVYLDSTPFGSLTSLLQAGLAGVPCCSWRPRQSLGGASVLACDDIAFSSLRNAVTYDDREKYWQQLCTYLDDPAAAASAAQELGQNIAKHHMGEAWRATLNEAYSIALGRTETRPHSRHTVLDGKEDQTDLILLALQGGFVGNPPSASDYFAARTKRGFLSRINRSLKKRIHRRMGAIGGRL